MPPEPTYGRRRARSRAKEWRLSTSDDVERALTAAERLLRQGEERRRHTQNRTFAMLSLIVGLALSVFASLVAVVQGYNAPSLAAAGLTLLVGTAVLAAAFRELLRIRETARYDQTLRLAAELASIAREAFLEVAEREEWSYVRVQSTKLRLSAFPIHDSARSLYQDER